MWRFCSEECSHEFAHLHAAVCHDHKSQDVSYVKSQLAQAIGDMMEDIDDRYDEQDIDDACTVLSAFYDTSLDNATIQSAIEEAHEIITDHLYDHGGHDAFLEAHPVVQKELIGSHPDYRLHHLTNIAFDRIAASEEDEYRAARTALRNAKKESNRLVREAKRRAKQMLSEPQKRYNAARRAVRGKRRNERGARRNRRQAERLRKKASRQERKFQRQAVRKDKRADKLAPVKAQLIPLEAYMTNSDDDDSY